MMTSHNLARKTYMQPASPASVPSDLNRDVEVLLRRIRLAVVHGADKTSEGAVLRVSDNLRPWKSYKSVAEDIAGAMTRLGVRAPVTVLPDDIGLAATLRVQETHMAWLNTAGVQGRSAIVHTPGLLEMLGLPYVGHEPLVAGVLDNKHLFKQQLLAAGLPTAPSLLVRRSEGHFLPTESARFAQVFRGYRGPFIVKPVSGRASLHVTFVDSALHLREAVATVQAQTKAPVLIERYLGGAEYCVAVAGPVVAQNGVLSRRGEPFVFSALERVLDEGEKVFTSMDVKPISQDRTHVLDPHRDRKVLTELERLARAVFDEFGLDTLVRLDIRADVEGNLYILEANPKPDLKAPAPGQTSLVSIGLDQFGMSYDDLILSIFANRVDGLLAERNETFLRLVGRS
jgi:D-alanine-D-alanine ligase